MNVVISQPMLFPWVGMLEQVRLADVYVHYSDVQFSKGSFVNRVQVKSVDGIKWITVPLQELRLGQRIDQVQVNEDKPWRQQHLELLRQAYKLAPFCSDMLGLVQSVYRRKFESLAELAEASLLAVCRYFSLDEDRRFIRASDLRISGSGSQRVLEVVLGVGGDRYLTGLGARNYLDHDIFENAGIRVEYMDYQMLPYPQLHGEFTPYVSTLDLVANVGVNGRSVIRSGTVYWKDYIANG